MTQEARNHHQNEIINSRKKGFGGSDARLIYKIGTRGVSSLTSSDIKRIQVALGMREPDVIEPTPAMIAGHDFEDYIEERYQQQGYFAEREMLLDGSKMIPAVTHSLPFAIFAHADFVTETEHDSVDEDVCWMRVVECKYSQDESEKVKNDYMAQFQWYYWLGATEVTLVHGWGGVFPFNVEGVEYIDIMKDESYLAAFDRGVLELKSAIECGMFNQVSSDLEVVDCPKDVQAQMELLTEALRAIKAQEEKADEMKAQIKNFMEANGILNIKGEGFSIAYVQPSERKTFDTKKAQAKYEDLKGDEFYKKSKVSSSVRINVK